MWPGSGLVVLSLNPLISHQALGLCGPTECRVPHVVTNILYVRIFSLIDVNVQKLWYTCLLPGVVFLLQDVQGADGRAAQGLDALVATSGGFPPLPCSLPA